MFSPIVDTFKKIIHKLALKTLTSVVVVVAVMDVGLRGFQTGR